MKDNKWSRVLIDALTKSNKAALIVVLLSVVMAFLTPTFLSSYNLLNVLRQVAVTVIVGAGFCIIIACGDLDLSVGSVMALVGVVLAKLMVAGFPCPSRSRPALPPACAAVPSTRFSSIPLTYRDSS